MSFAKRKNQILNHLMENKTSTTKELSQILSSTISTTRRDLIKLQQEGLIKRTHGSVILTQETENKFNFKIDTIENIEEKSQIVQKAKNLIQDNTTIFLDTSKITQLLCPIIKEHTNINVITNGLNIAKYFQNAEKITCIIAPGILKPGTMTISGQFTEEFLKNFKADQMFFSCKSITKDGIYDDEITTYNTKKAMMQNSKKHILLIENQRENENAYMKIANLEEIDTIISQDKFTDDLENTIKQKKINHIK